MGTFQRKNLLLGGLVYGGVYDNYMSFNGGNDNTFNYFAGGAVKGSYNWRLGKAFVIQPNVMTTYNYFGQQNWHTGYGEMGMMAGMMNGVNIAPGLNFIWEKETFSAYATIQYMFNINNKIF